MASPIDLVEVLVGAGKKHTLVLNPYLVESRLDQNAAMRPSRASQIFQIAETGMGVVGESLIVGSEDKAGVTYISPRLRSWHYASKRLVGPV